MIIKKAITFLISLIIIFSFLIAPKTISVKANLEEHSTYEDWCSESSHWGIFGFSSEADCNHQFDIRSSSYLNTNYQGAFNHFTQWIQDGAYDIGLYDCADYQAGFDAGYADGLDAGYDIGFQAATPLFHDVFTYAEYPESLYVLQTRLFDYSDLDLIHLVVFIDDALIYYHGSARSNTTFIIEESTSEHWGNPDILKLTYAAGTTDMVEIHISQQLTGDDNFRITYTRDNTDIDPVITVYSSNEYVYQSNQEAYAAYLETLDGLSWSWLVGFFNLFGVIFNLELIPGIRIGYIIGIPIAFGLLAWFFKMVRG